MGWLVTWLLGAVLFFIAMWYMWNYKTAWMDKDHPTRSETWAFYTVLIVASLGWPIVLGWFFCSSVFESI